MKRLVLLAGSLLTVAMTSIMACVPQTTSPPPSATYSPWELRYLLISEFGDVFYVDSDFYPVAREGEEEQNARERFPAIQADRAEFSAILEHLGIDEKTAYTLDEMLAVYREHKKLTQGVELTPSGDAYGFVLRVGEGQGERIEGTITAPGRITVLKREPSFNTVPICLVAGTLIDTPLGQIPVEQLAPGASLWSQDESGTRVLSTIEKTSTTPAPAGFRTVKVVLSDGRSVTASPGHPTAMGRALGDYEVGETLDGAIVVAVQSLAYGGATYDILPSTPTRSYRANGILLLSTLDGD